MICVPLRVCFAGDPGRSYRSYANFGLTAFSEVRIAPVQHP
jgi:hypothetical protein